jgi:hypothetical protein
MFSYWTTSPESPDNIKDCGLSPDAQPGLVRKIWVSLWDDIAQIPAITLWDRAEFRFQLTRVVADAITYTKG